MTFDVGSLTHPINRINYHLKNVVFSPHSFHRFPHPVRALLRVPADGANPQATCLRRQPPHECSDSGETSQPASSRSSAGGGSLQTGDAAPVGVCPAESDRAAPAADWHRFRAAPETEAVLFDRIYYWG